VAELVARPRHPYTVGLLRSLPGHAPDQRYLKAIPGAPPSLRDAPSTCAFRPRCELAVERCATWRTSLLEAGGSRAARCLRHAEVPRV
jgi:oligopeptide/dipeptide ABC transporter ATP-binding protein